ncbi:hypothetical protein SDC9_188995 [bioreactor metagenome]|uniref:Uncharacterized protein n=1 Tax=bioreactor metagenome TaxID=1076179 RepID=A0A645HTB7_9ZZZZ
MVGFIDNDHVKIWRNSFHAGEYIFRPYGFQGYYPVYLDPLGHLFVLLKELHEITGPEYPEILIEPLFQLSPPFLTQPRRTDDEYPVRGETGFEFRQYKTGFDGFSQADLVANEYPVFF